MGTVAREHGPITVPGPEFACGVLVETDVKQEEMR